MSDRVLGTCAIEFRGREPARRLVEEAGFEFVHLLGSPPWPNEETREKLAGFAGILAGGEYFTPHTMELAGDLRVIARNGVGYDRVDLDLCTERGIVVANTPGAMADAVADHAMALLLSAVRHIVPGDRTVKSGGYRVALSEDLCAMTLGLIGCGRIGARGGAARPRLQNARPRRRPLCRTEAAAGARSHSRRPRAAAVRVGTPSACTCRCRRRTPGSSTSASSPP